jgi:uncharacterized FlgJ-related protein
MAWTQTEIDSLKASIAQGVLTVKFANREVTYRSLREMRETLAMMQADVASTTRPRAYVIRSGKGL